jgi:hypothetical protein
MVVHTQWIRSEINIILRLTAKGADNAKRRALNVGAPAVSTKCVPLHNDHRSASLGTIAATRSVYSTGSRSGITSSCEIPRAA